MPETKRMSTKEVPFMGIPKKKSLRKGIPEAHAEHARHFHKPHPARQNLPEFFK